MNKEVEAAIKRIRNTIVYSGRKSGKTIYFEDINLIIEQAERVQELEKRLKIYQRRSWFEDYEKVAKENKRYREALEFYADRKTYKRRHDPYEPLDTDINDDSGEKARKALEESK